MNLPIIKDFSENLPTNQLSSSSIVESARANKEVEAAVILSKKFPRNEQASVNRIINACSRPALANKSIYSFKRGGQKVEGPTIRLAEVIARNWGNLHFGVKETERRDGFSVVEAFCWDLETNVRSIKEFTVQHVRDTQQGPKQLTNERDIYEMVANQGARRLRNCILSTIPEDVIDLAVQNINQTLLQAAKGNAVDMQAKIRSMLEAFNELDVTRDMIEKYLNVKPEAASAKQILDLGKIYVSLKDGYSEIEDWFKVDKPSLSSGIIKEDNEKAINDKIDEIEALKNKAEELGISRDTLNKINGKSNSLADLTRASEMLNTVITSKMAEKNNPKANKKDS